MSALKSRDEALTDMLRAYWSLTGTEPDMVDGGVVLSIFEALAFQVNDLSARFDDELTRVLPESIYAAFGFGRAPARVATTPLRFTLPVPAAAPTLIPSGTTWETTEGVEFAVAQDATVPVGALFVDAPALATQPGANGNVPPFTAGRLTSGLPGIASVQNVSAGVGGSDAETDEARAARFGLHLSTLDRSSAEGLRAALLLLVTDAGETLQDVLIRDGNDDPAITPGTFDVHLFRPGGVSAPLLAAAQRTVEAARAAGCLPAYHTTGGIPVPVTAQISVFQFGASAAAEAAAAAYLDTLGFGVKLSRENLITALTNAHRDITEVTLTAPAADVLASGPTAHFTLGTLTITETRA